MRLSGCVIHDPNHAKACTNRQCCDADNAKGWLGLLLGTRLWYSFANAEQDDEPAFQKRVDNLCRELADRGMNEVESAAEGVPPAPAPAPAQTSVQAPVSRTVASPSFSPSPQASVPPPIATPSTKLSAEQRDSSSLTAVTLMDLSAFMTKQLGDQREYDAKMRQELESQLSRQRVEVAQMQEEVQKMRDIASAKTCVSDGQLEQLQTRLDALHQAKLITDGEMDLLADSVADYIECRSSLNPATPELSIAAEKVKKMVGLSEGMGKDAMLARQLRRKYTT